MVNDMVPTKEMLNEYLHSEFKNVDAQAEIWYWAGIAAYAHLSSAGSDEWKKQHGFSEEIEQ